MGGVPGREYECDPLENSTRRPLWLREQTGDARRDSAWAGGSTVHNSQNVETTQLSASR